ncbi:MAG: hypothetical protein MJE77_34820 [Proteobacteria bacterium]|nr:hypothetical protein [Pseudomonadota bacterium]
MERFVLVRLPSYKVVGDKNADAEFAFDDRSRSRRPMRMTDVDESASEIRIRFRDAICITGFASDLRAPKVHD